MANVKIELAGTPNKLLIHTEKDVSILGWKTVEKFQKYEMEATPWNLIDLFENKEKLGLEIEYDPLAMPAIEELREEARVYNRAIKFKTCSQEEVNEAWEEEGFPILFPKIKADMHQKRMVLWLLATKKAGCYMEQGTGKTAVGILAFGKLLSEGLIKRPLILAPLSLLNDTAWYKDLAEFSDHAPVDLRENRFAVRDGCFNFVNYDKLQSWCYQKTDKAERSYDENNYFEKCKFDAIYYDESSSLITPGSLRTKAFLKIARHANYIMLASGTPAPTNIFQIWPQMKSIGSVLGDSYSAFEQRYGFQISVGPVMKWKPRSNAEMIIRKRIDKATYFIKREDAIDLPMRKYVNVDVDLSDEHMKLYRQVENDYFAAVDGFDEHGNELSGHARVTHEVTMRIKLLQITSGFVAVEDEHGDVRRVSLPWNAKLDKLDEIVKSHLAADPSNNVIVWCCFRWEVEKIYSIYKDIAVFVYGGMSTDKRDGALKKWLRDPACRMMISIPASTKFGHTWLKANASIYFSGTEDFQNYSQSRDRNYRRGQTREVTEYKLISKGTVEKKIWIAIANKKKLDSFLKNYAIERNAENKAKIQA